MAGENYGYTIKFGDGADPEVFTTVCGVRNNPIELAAAPTFIDVTHSCSTRREYISGLSDSADWTLELNYLTNDAQHNAIRAAADAGETRNFQLIITDGTNVDTFDFAVALSHWTPQASIDDANRCLVYGKVSGEFTLTQT